MNGTVPVVSAHFRSLYSTRPTRPQTLKVFRFVRSTWTELTCNKSTQLHHAFIGHARQRHDLIGCSETRTIGAQSVQSHVFQCGRFEPGVISVRFVCCEQAYSFISHQSTPYSRWHRPLVRLHSPEAASCNTAPDRINRSRELWPTNLIAKINSEVNFSFKS